MVKAIYNDNINPYDAAALFWYTRNILFYEMHLNSNKDVLLIKYEDKILNSISILKEIYSFVNIDYPGDYLVKKIHSGALKRGEQIQLLPQLEKLCKDLYLKMDKDYSYQQEKLTIQN